jgi:hypothetical protein
MNRYEPLPRVAFGFAAVAMTAITIGVLVVCRRKWSRTARRSPCWAANSDGESVRAILKCVDLAAVRDIASAPDRSADIKCKEQG